MDTPDRTPAAPYCRCHREGDLWHCADRPALERDPEGNRCALGATLAASGSDRDPRAELARALAGGGHDGR